MSGDQDEGILFTQQMRKATRNIHNTSDALVNAKLGVTMTDDSVWAEGLLVFYEVFAFLERALVNHKDSLIGDLLIPGMTRTSALEADLAYYLGDNWRVGYTVRPEVQKYLDHLQNIENQNPYLLIPYVYHLYMGLFSGGQILRAKRVISMSGNSDSVPGNNVTSYGEFSIGPLKNQLRAAVNEVANQLDEDTRQEILEEGVTVFKMNNLVIGSVEGIDRVLKRRLMKLLIALVLLFVFIFFWMSQIGEKSDLDLIEEEEIKEL